MQNIYRIIVKFLLKYYALVLLLGFASLLWSIPQMAYLLKHISTDPVDLLPRDFPSVQSLLKISEKVEVKKRFGVMLESDNPKVTFQAIQDLIPYLDKLSLVGKVYLTKPGYDFFDKNKFLFVDVKDLEDIRDRIDRKIQQKKLGGFYVDLENTGGDKNEELNFSDLEDKYRGKYGGEGAEKYYVSPNGRVYALYVESKYGNLDISHEKQFQDEVKSAVESFNYKSYDPTMKLYFGGSARVVEYRALLKDLKVAGIISGIVIFLPLLIRFRRPQYVFLIFIPLIVGIPLGMGLASFWIHKLNVTTSFLFAILGGLGVETGIHLFSRYHETRAEGASVSDSILDLYVFLGPPILTAVAALAVTFLLMVFSEFRGFSEFGFISGVGLWTVFLLYFTFFPALLIFSEKIHLLKFKHGIETSDDSWKISPAFVKTVLGVFLLFSLFSLFVIPKIRFEYDTKKIRADRGVESVAKVKQRLTQGVRVNQPAAVLIQNSEEAELLKRKVESIKASNPNSLIDYTSSVYSIVPTQQDEKMAILKEIEALLSDDSIKLVKADKRKDLDRFKLELKKPAPFNLSEVPEEVKAVFLGNNKQPGSLFLIFPQPNLEMDDGRNAIEFSNEIGTLQTVSGNYHPSNSAIVFADVLKTMFRDSKKIMVIAILSVFFFVYLDFRRWKPSLLVMASILLGMIWVLGAMYLLGIKLNIYNMVMLPAVMGMSIDNSIHVYHSYEELGTGSLGKVLKSAGLSSLLASLTNAAGFVGLMFCSHGGLRSMGVVAVTGVIACLLTTLVFLPMYLQFSEWRQEKSLKDDRLISVS